MLKDKVFVYPLYINSKDITISHMKVINRIQEIMGYSIHLDLFMYDTDRQCFEFCMSLNEKTFEDNEINDEIYIIQTVDDMFSLFVEVVKHSYLIHGFKVNDNIEYVITRYIQYVISKLMKDEDNSISREEFIKQI